MISDTEKARLLESVMNGHSAIITWMATAWRPQCTCDSSTGRQCEDCGAMKLFKHLRRVQLMLKKDEKGPKWKRYYLKEP